MANAQYSKTRKARIGPLKYTFSHANGTIKASAISCKKKELYSKNQND